jgi:hypothetical protein
MARGSLSALSYETKRDARMILGHDITLRELRLLPYIDWCCKNSCFHYERINMEEMAILKDWEAKNLLRIGEMLHISQYFYTFMSRVLWDAYVEKEE